MILTLVRSGNDSTHIVPKLKRLHSLNSSVKLCEGMIEVWGAGKYYLAKRWVNISPKPVKELDWSFYSSGGDAILAYVAMEYKNSFLVIYPATKELFIIGSEFLDFKPGISTPYYSSLKDNLNLNQGKSCLTNLSHKRNSRLRQGDREGA